jgi:hypothetical protein
MTEFKRSRCSRGGGRKREPSVFAQATCITMCGQTFITTELEIFGGTLQNLYAGMSKPLMPKGCGDGDVETLGRMHEGVEIAGGVTSVNHPSRCQILDREAKRVKFD